MPTRPDSPKIILLFLILFLKNSYAEAIPSSYLSSGFYTSVGVTNVVSTDVLELSNSSNNFTFFRAPANNNNIGLSFLLGYQQIMNRFILSANGAYRYISGPVSRSVKLNIINAPRVTTNTNLGLELRPGFLINPQVSVYGILGLERTYYKVQYVFHSNVAFSAWQYGPGIGIGCNVAFTPKFLLMLDYLYIKSRDLNFSDRPGQTNVVLYPTMNIFSLALGYQW